MHFPNLVQIVGFGGVVVSDLGGYLSVALVSESLMLGSLL